MVNIQPINVGSAPNNGSGEPLRSALTKANDNFAAIVAAIDPSLPIAAASGTAKPLATWVDILDKLFQVDPSLLGALIQATAAPGAVNGFQFYANVAGGGPAIIATGPDANIDINLTAKGTGGLAFGNGTDYTPIFQIDTTRGDSAAIGVGLSVGRLGNGAAAFGRFPLALGYTSLVSGNAPRATGAYAVVQGNQPSDRGRNGTRVYASETFNGASASSQLVEQIQRAITTDATPTIATVDGQAVNGSNCLVLPSNCQVLIEYLIQASNNATGDSAGWKVTAGFERRPATMTKLGSTGESTALWKTSGASSWSVATGVDNVQGSPIVTVTGGPARWQIVARLAEMVTA